MVSCPECLTPVVGNVLGRKGWTKLPEHFLKLPQRAYGVFRTFDVANQTGPCLTPTWHWPFKQVVSIYWTSVVFNMGMTGLFTRQGNTQPGMTKITLKKREKINWQLHCWENIIHQSEDGYDQGFLLQTLKQGYIGSYIWACELKTTYNKYILLEWRGPYMI